MAGFDVTTKGQNLAIYICVRSSIFILHKPKMLYKFLNRLFRGMFEDWYFSYSRAKWTNDPKYSVVQLRNRVLELIEGRISEVTGVTASEEIYVLAPGDGRYTLTRVCGEKIVEGTYLNEKDQFSPLAVIPRLLEIRGNPYKITRKESSQISQVVLNVEKLNQPR